jgi:hypothetical protein
VSDMFAVIKVGDLVVPKRPKEMYWWPKNCDDKPISGLVTKKMQGSGGYVLAEIILNGKICSQWLSSLVRADKY